MTKPIPPSDMWDRLAEAEARCSVGAPETLSDGWFTAYDYQEQRKIRRGAARSRLESLVNAGELETKQARLMIGGQARSVRAYRLKDK